MCKFLRSYSKPQTQKEKIVKAIDKHNNMWYNNNKKEACVMEMQIASTAMSMAMMNMQNGLAVGMLKKTMDASEQSMEAITEMLDSIPSPDGKGQILDVRA